MNHIFITNNFGKRDPYEITNEIFKYCVQNNMEYEIIRNRDDLSTEDIVRKYAKEGNVIYAVGGDGMINKVLNGVVNTGASLGFIPYGTGNDFNRVMEKLDDGSYNVNVGKINDKFFINVACFGIDADISNDERFIHNEFIPKQLRYHTGALYHFINYEPKQLEVRYGNKTVLSDFSTIAVCNGNYYGGGYNIAPKANLFDYAFDVYFVNRLNRIKLANTILKMKNGNHEELKYVKKLLLDELTIRSKHPIKANIDGEVLEDEVFTISFDNNIKIVNNQDMVKKVLRK